MGPFEVDCPDRIMRLLSPIEKISNPGYSAGWRLRVAAAKEKRKTSKSMVAQLKPGVVIKLAHEATIGKAGVVGTEFRLRYFRKRTPIFEPVAAPGLLCRLHRQTLETATIVPPPSIEATGQA